MSITRGISELVKRCSVPVTVQERSTGQLQEGSAASKKKDMWSTVVTRKISGLVTRRISGLLTRITTVVNYKKDQRASYKKDQWARHKKDQRANYMISGL